MSEPNAEPSLIQQRMALQRRRSFALYMLISASVLTTGWVVAVLLDPSAPYRWVSILVFGSGVVIGLVELRKARRDIRAFEERHGRDAGRQG